ncbi:MAG: DNA/RNA non-specific endonuclease [Bacteroidales bacterium]|nr:DNA/RNA non-specific endonuclease [Bacteroidales bacterium]
MKRFLIFLISLSVFAGVSGQDNLELQVLKPREELVRHKHFALAFVEGYELASWVAYSLTANQLLGGIEYKEKFEEDPLVSTGSATKKDYKDAGYLPGQLVPAEDMMFSEEAVMETFYYSNTAPMKQAFYKYTWKKTEDMIREWVKETDTLYIVAGPVLADSPFPTFGENKVSIPSRFYKVVLDLKSGKGFGFMIKSSLSTGALKPTAMSIDEVEKITGIDFFSSLPDEDEEKIESGFNLSDWNFEILDK